MGAPHGGAVMGVPEINQSDVRFLGQGRRGIFTAVGLRQGEAPWSEYAPGESSSTVQVGTAN
jgi:hypothetical protein